MKKVARRTFQVKKWKRSDHPATFQMAIDTYYNADAARKCALKRGRATQPYIGVNKPEWTDSGYSFIPTEQEPRSTSRRRIRT